MKIDGYEFPEELWYDRDHNWARIEGDVATIGLTDLGQDLAGEILYAEVPRVGRQISQGEAYMSLESGKWVGRIKAIVSGTIAAINEEIEFESRILNDDPYGDGWVARVKLSGQPAGLLRASDPAYAAFIAAERQKHGK